MVSLRPLPFKLKIESSSAASSTVTSLDSSHGSSATSASASPTGQSFDRQFSNSLEEQWQSDAYYLSGTQTQPTKADSYLKTAPPKGSRKIAKTSCLMGAMDHLELGFYSCRPSGHITSSAVAPERIAPRRGRVNRLLSRLTFKSTDPQLGNFHAVDAVVLRGAMPESAADFAHLKQKYGVGTIIDLRGWETSQPAFIDYERYQCHQNGMRYLHLPMDSHAPPTLGQLQLFFRVIEKSRQCGETVYVHCKQGVDRTGALVAAYQVATGHSQDQAFAEMRRYGYNWRHQLTRPAQQAFVLNPTLPAILKKAQRGAELQKQAQTLKETGILAHQHYRVLLDDLAQGDMAKAQKRLNLASTAKIM